MSFFPGLHRYGGYRDMYWDTREPQLGLVGEGVRGVLNPFLGGHLRPLYVLYMYIWVCHLLFMLLPLSFF